MSNVIVTDQDNTLMNVVGIVFPSLIAILCRYHITKNLRAQLKPAVGTKEKRLNTETWSNPVLWLRR